MKDLFTVQTEETKEEGLRTSSPVSNSYLFLHNQTPPLHNHSFILVKKTPQFLCHLMKRQPWLPYKGTKEPVEAVELEENAELVSHRRRGVAQRYSPGRCAGHR